MAEWMPGVERIETAAQGGYGVAAGQMRPKAAMSHVMQGFQRTMIDWARERPRRTPASAHFTIGRGGRIVQHVALHTPSWHCGRLDPGSPPTWPLWNPAMNPSGETVGIEHEGFSAPAFDRNGRRIDDYVYSAGRPWPEPMVAASLRVHAWILGELGLEPSDETVIGHNETAPRSRANDPGPAWPQGRILAALTGEEEEQVKSNAYLVEPTDNLGKIARLFGVTVAELVEWNGIVDADKIEVGDVLRLRADAPRPRPPTPLPPGIFLGAAKLERGERNPETGAYPATISIPFEVQP